MNFNQVKIIEDVAGLLKSKKVTISKQCLLVGPTDIQDVEYWEERMVRCGVPYVTAQFETSVQLNDEELEKADAEGVLVKPIVRYARGYGVFVEKESFNRIEAVNE